VASAVASTNELLESMTVTRKTAAGMAPKESPEIAGYRPCKVIGLC
jgi:hypothetical protein